MNLDQHDCASTEIQHGDSYVEELGRLSMQVMQIFPDHSPMALLAVDSVPRCSTTMHPGVVSVAAALGDEQLRQLNSPKRASSPTNKHSARRKSTGGLTHPGAPAVTPLQLPLNSPTVPPSPTRTPITSRTPAVSASPAHAASSGSNGNAGSSDSSDTLMFEEQLRVAVLAVQELHQLVSQRRKGLQQGQGHSQYAALSNSQAEAMTGHLLLTANSLLQQLAAQWTVQHRDVPPQPAGVQCLDPSPLPLPRKQLCPCRTPSSGDVLEGSHTSPSTAHVLATPTKSPHSRNSEVESSIDGTSRGLSISTASPNGSAATALSPQSSSAATPSSTSVRRIALPFSNISLLEKNIVGLRTARGNQLRSQKQQQAAAQQQQQQQQPPQQPVTSEQPPSQNSDGTTKDTSPHESPGVELVHPRDIQLLSSHFSQLLTPHLQPVGSSLTPLALCHPFALLTHHFLTHWKHQAEYIKTSNTTRQSATAAIATHGFGAVASAALASSRAAGVVIDRSFVQHQLSSIFMYLQNQEQFIVVAYPHLHQTSLCRRVLRNTMRSALLNHSAVFTTLCGWSEHACAADDRQLTLQIDRMKHCSLREIGVQFPFNLDPGSLVGPADRAGEGGLAGEVSSVQRAESNVSTLDDDADEEELGLPASSSMARIVDGDAPIDKLIHSDEEGENESERGILQTPSVVHKPTHQQKPSSRTVSSGDEQWRAPSATSARTGLQGADPSAAGMKRNSSAGALSLMSSSPRLPGQLGAAVTAQQQQFPSTQLSQSTSLLNLRSVLGGSHTAQQSSSSGPPSPGRVDNRGHGRDHSSESSPLPGGGRVADYPEPATTAVPDQPYERSIALLATLDNVHTIDGKLEVLVHVCRSITRELNEFLVRHGLQDTMPPPGPANGSIDPSNSSNGQGSFGLSCDDLFQIFAYCLLHAQLTSPVATMFLLSECIDGTALSGEAGFCLTTMQCAVQLILTFDETTVAPSAQHAPPVPAGQMTPLSRSFVETRHHSGQLAGPHSFSSTLSPLSKQSILSTSASSISSIGSGGSIGPTSIKPVIATNSPATSASGSSSSNVDTSYYAQLLANNLDAFCVAADYLEADSSWQWLYEKAGVTVYRKLYDTSPLYSIKGVAIIPRPPALLQAFFRNINNRVHIDDLYIGGRVLQHLSPDTKLVTYRFRARNWCQRQQTDMTLLLHHGVCSDGVSLVVLAFSVPLPTYPPQSGFSRATVRASGWLLKPLQVGGATHTHVTYIISPDGNGFPTWVVNALSSKQPMLIRNLREYLLATTTVETPPPSEGGTPNTTNAKRRSGTGPPVPHTAPSAASPLQ